MWQLDGKLKKRGVSQLLWIQVNEDGNSGRMNQEIWMPTFTNMDYYQVLDCLKYAKYCCEHWYNMHKYINTSSYETTT